MMRWFYVAKARRRSLFARRQFDEQIDADLQFHLEQAAAEYIREGLSPDQARRAALRACGNPIDVREDVRETSIWIWWERLAQDLRYGLRRFRRSPALSGTAVLSLAILGAVQAMDANFAATQVLLAVAETHTLSGPAKDAYIEATNRMLRAFVAPKRRDLP